MRATIARERLKISTRRTIEVVKWSAASGKAKGSNNDARTPNSFMDAIKTKPLVKSRNSCRKGSPSTQDGRKSTLSRIQLLPDAIEIFEQYEDFPSRKDANCLLPLLSNQKMNTYLKEIAECCGIHKPFTDHTESHTFSATVTLSKGVPVERTSKMLGHRI